MATSLASRGLSVAPSYLSSTKNQHSNAPASACTSDYPVPVTNSSCAGILTSFAKSAALISPTDSTCPPISEHPAHRSTRRDELWIYGNANLGQFVRWPTATASARSRRCSTSSHPAGLGDVFEWFDCASRA
jgi:hypothetical protein